MQFQSASTESQLKVILTTEQPLLVIAGPGAGKTKTLVSRWSSDEDTFENNYVNRMNVYLNRFILRDYKPFRIGPFFPSQISRLFVILNPSVRSFYEGPLELHDKCVFTFSLVFPSNPRKKKKNPSLFGKAMFGVLNSMTNGAFGYANVAVFDMHMCEVYLSWYMALSEEIGRASCRERV